MISVAWKNIGGGNKVCGHIWCVVLSFIRLSYGIWRMWLWEHGK